MRAMRTLLLSVVVALAALPIGCSEDDRDGANDDAGQGSGASAGTGGKGGAGSGGTTGTVDEGAGNGGAPADAGDAAAARLPLCESICTTQGETSCPPPDHDECVAGWCVDADVYYAGCVDLYDAMLDCMVDEPATSYYCDDTGMSFPKEEACEGEQSAFITCLMATLE